MKKLAVIIIILFIAATSARANIFLDVFGLYNNTGYANNQTAPGLTPPSVPGFAGGFNVTRDVSLIFRGYSSNLITDNNTFVTSGTYTGMPKEKKYYHKAYNGGLEYIYPIIIPSIDQGLGWRSSILAGYSQTEIKKSSKTTATPAEIAAGASGFFNETESDRGLAFQITTGIQINILQHLSAFLDLGYHKSFYMNEFEKKNISGYQVMLGVRVYAFKFRSIGEDY